MVFSFSTDSRVIISGDFKRPLAGSGFSYGGYYLCFKLYDFLDPCNESYSTLICVKMLPYFVCSILEI